MDTKQTTKPTPPLDAEQPILAWHFCQSNMLTRYDQQPIDTGFYLGPGSSERECDQCDTLERLNGSKMSNQPAEYQAIYTATYDAVRDVLTQMLGSGLLEETIARVAKLEEVEAERT